MNLIEYPFLKSGVLEHLAIHGSGFLFVNNALNRGVGGDKWCVRDLELLAQFRGRRYGFLWLFPTRTSSSATSPPAAALRSLSLFGNGRSNLHFILKRGTPFMGSLDALFAFDSVECYFLGSSVLRIGSSLLRLINNDSFKLLFFIEEIRYVEKCITLQSNVDKG